MKYRLILILMLTSISVSAQTSWTNVGNGLQQRVVAGKTEYRFTKISPYPPFGITDSLGRYLPLSGGNMTGNIYYNGDINPNGTGILFGKNTDEAKIYFESSGDDAGDSNLILEAASNIDIHGGPTEGFVFRKTGDVDGGLVTLDLLALNLTQFKYKTFDIFHTNNLDTSIFQRKIYLQNSLTPDATNKKYPTVTAINTGLALKANDNAVVHLSGTETISGSKTFSSFLTGAAASFSGAVTALSYGNANGNATISSAGNAAFNGFVSAVGTGNFGGSGSFGGNVSSNPIPTLGDHLTNKTYVDSKVQNSLTASTTIAPSATAVNTGLGLKFDKSGGTISGVVTMNNGLNVSGGIAARNGATIDYYSAASTTQALTSLASSTVSSGIESGQIAFSRNTPGGGYYLSSIRSGPSNAALETGISGTVAVTSQLNLQTVTDGGSSTTNGANFGGSIGIGTSSPSERLQVNGAIRSTGAAFTNFPSSSGFDYFNGDARIISGGANPATKGGFRIIQVSSNGSIVAEPFVMIENGFIGLSTASPGYRLDVAGDINASANVRAAGVILTSDIRLKDTLSVVPSVASKIRTIAFKWKDKTKRDAKMHFGYAAQDVEKYMPDAVDTDAKGIKAVNYIEVLVAKIKELEDRIKALESK